MIKHLIFDFGGVYLDLGGRHSGIPAQLAQVLNVSEDMATQIWNENRGKIVTGQQTPIQFLQEIKQNLKLNINVNQSYERWKSLNHLQKEKINWELANYTAELKKKYNLFMLTDTIDLENGAGEWIHEITSHFIHVFKSYEIKLRKPNPAAFLYVLAKINARPEDCLFIDDHLENINAAKQLGIQTIKYENLRQLKKEIQLLESNTSTLC